MQAQQLLTNLENEALIGLKLNSKKTKVMIFNQPAYELETISHEKLESVENFKYLGSWMESSEKDFEVRKALAWSNCHKLRKIWSSNISSAIKKKLFISTVESTLLYGSETWTVSKTLEKKLNECYTCMLRMCLNVSWQQKLTNDQLYGDLPPVSHKVAIRRMRLAGHCARHPELVASSLILWEPKFGNAKRGRPAVNYLNTLKNDTGLETANELLNAMQDRTSWKEYSRLVRAGARPK